MKSFTYGLLQQGNYTQGGGGGGCKGGGGGGVTKKESQKSCDSHTNGAFCEVEGHLNVACPL